ncbi:MAG TPA: laccase domain-containing protein, partial [Firmicutes bacterium]|nr:laccase domain-containing protein [Bacillota bacterium]
QDAGKEWGPGAPGIAHTDGLITATPGLVLSGFFADCSPVFLVDPVRRVVGLIHAGKRGTLEGIIPVAIRTMAGAFGVCPEDVIAGVGPCIGPCCYDMDLPGTIRNELLAVGLTPSHILMSGLCTSCSKGDFFSYRRDLGTTGRMGAYIGIISQG